MLNILFRAVSQTLLQFGKNPENGLGGTLGFIALLHTWDQQINDHFHLHCLIPGGALSPYKNKWISCSNDFLFPERALSRVFRGKFIDLFERAYLNNELIFPGKTQIMGTVNGFKGIKKQLWSKDWVIKVKDPIETPENVLEYVGRYTHRVAISNDRILSLKEGKVTFAYKDRDTGLTKTVNIDAVEFIRRFLKHVLPKGFMRIRNYGLLANRCKKVNLGRCRELLGLCPVLPEVIKLSARDMMLKKMGKDITKCPFCLVGTMRKVAVIPDKEMGLNVFNVIG